MRLQFRSSCAAVSASDGLAYNVAAIPTMYRGRQYRSRLEARWAAFFDQLGWHHEYEPFDLGKWSPDFQIVSPYSGSVLVEVKPITEFHGATAKRMASAAFERGMGGDATLLLVGTCPVATPDFVQIGWIGHVAEDTSATSFAQAALGWLLDSDRPGAHADIMYRDYPDQDTCWSGALHLYPAFSFGGDIRAYADHAMRLWAAASNQTQWKGTR